MSIGAADPTQGARRPRFGRAVKALGLIGFFGSGSAFALPPHVAETTPPRLRVCCPLGHDLSLRVGPLNLPVKLGNVVEAGGLGHHRYAARSVFDEINGLVYTCRGGLIDMGHLRTAADIVGWLYVHLRRARASNAPVQLEGPDGPFELWARGAPDDETLRRAAAQAAFRLTVWHELSTFHGGRTVGMFPEGFSAFSPEDLPSDAWGARVGYDALRSSEPWDEAVGRAISTLLGTLESRSLTQTRAALRALSRRAWDPSRSVPEPELLVARRFEVSPPLAGLMVPVATCPEAAPASVELIAADQLEASYGLRFASAPPALKAAVGRPMTAQFLESLARDAEARFHTEAAASTSSASSPLHPPSGRPLRSFANAQQAIRLLPVQLFGGVSGQRSTRGAFGLSVAGGVVESLGGDATVIRLTTLFGPSGRGLVTHVTGLRADALFFCRERGTERIHPPVAAWVQACERGGLIGLGGKLLTVQLDGRTGRFVMQPVELHLALDLFQSAFADAYFRHRLILEAGGSVETAKTPNQDADLSVRARVALSGLIRSRDQRFELSGRTLVHQDATEGGDRGLEARVRLLFRTPPPPRVSGDAAWGQVELGAELAFRRWTRPGSSIADTAWPLGSAQREDAWHAVAFVGFSAGGLTF